MTVEDVTGDGVREVIFHSGTEGASDYTCIEKIVRYDPARDSFSEIQLDEFYQTGTHVLTWLDSGNRHLLVLSKRGEWPSVDHCCNYCDSPFIFDAYKWNQRNRTFDLIRAFQSETQHGSGPDALEQEWPCIEATLKKPQ